jgi:hypothetical protein
MKKKVILIGGYLASGKSTFSNIISKRFNIPVFNKDIIKEVLATELVTPTREENKKLSTIAFRFLYYIASQAVSPLILESNFKDYEIVELQKLLEVKGYEILSFNFKGTFEIMHDRYLKRDATRNAIHRSFSLAKIEDYIDYAHELDKTVYPGEVININADTFDHQSDENLFKRIKDFLER